MLKTPPSTRIRRAFDRAVETYDQAAGIQFEALRAMIDNLPERLPETLSDAQGHIPATVLDLGCGTGLALPLLRSRYPAARLLGIDLSEVMLRAADRQGSAHNLQKIGADAALLPLGDATCDMIFCNLTWQWCTLPEVLAEAFRILKPNGILAFSTLLRGTFRELAAAFDGIDRHPHTLNLLTADQVLDALHSAGFSAPTSRHTTRTARYSNLGELLRAIRATGATEISGQRRRGLLGKVAWQRITNRYDNFADSNRQLPLTYEVLEVMSAR